jgi:O-methyltransferase
MLASKLPARIFRNPSKYLALAPKLAMQSMCRLFSGASFFLQGQMDLNSRSRWFNPEFVAKYGGYFLPSDTTERRVMDLEPWDSVRRDMLILLLRSLNDRDIPGQMAEVGVFRGYTARLIHHYMPDRCLHLFDTFAGFDERDAQKERLKTGFVVSPGHFANTSASAVRAYVQQRNDNLKIHPGFFPDSLPSELEGERFCFVHLDVDLYEPTLAGLKVFYSRMTPGGLIVVHDYNGWIGARKAVDEFFAHKVEVPIPMPDKSGSAVVVISGSKCRT